VVVESLATDVSESCVCFGSTGSMYHVSAPPIRCFYPLTLCALQIVFYDYDYNMTDELAMLISIGATSPFYKLQI